MDPLFVRKVSLGKLECINQITTERGTECVEEYISLNLSHDECLCIARAAFPCMTLSVIKTIKRGMISLKTSLFFDLGIHLINMCE